MSMIEIGEETPLYSTFKRNLIDFLSLNDHAKKYERVLFYLKLYHQMKISKKKEHCTGSTQQQLH